MPANIESMFSVRQMPWHREGEVLDDYPGTWAEARVLAGLDWDPVTTGVYTAAGINPDGSVHYEPVGGWKAISRSDTGTVLSVNKDSYTVIGHGEMGEIVEAVLAQPSVKWETAGVLDDGRAVWCLALLDSRRTAGRRQRHLAVSGHHQPARRHRRLRAARHRRQDRVRQHLPRRRTGRRADRRHLLLYPQILLALPAREARQAVTGARTEMRRYTELAHQLLGIPITPKQRELFVTEFIPMPPTGLVTDRVARNVEEARQALRMIFESKTTEQSPAPPTGSCKPQANTSTTSAPPGPGKPGSTGPSSARSRSSTGPYR